MINRVTVPIAALVAGLVLAAAVPSLPLGVRRVAGLPAVTASKPDGQAALLRSRVEAVGGHAMLLRASDQLRRNVDVFHPQNGGLAALCERVRNSFDPKRILNRGRMLRGSAA